MHPTLTGGLAESARCRSNWRIERLRLDILFPPFVRHLCHRILTTSILNYTMASFYSLQAVQATLQTPRGGTYRAPEAVLTEHPLGGTYRTPQGGIYRTTFQSFQGVQAWWTLIESHGFISRFLYSIDCRFIARNYGEFGIFAILRLSGTHWPTLCRLCTRAGARGKALELETPLTLCLASWQPMGWRQGITC